MERQANDISFFLLVSLFVLQGEFDDRLRILLALLLSWAVTSLAFVLRWLSLDGRFAAFAVGSLVLGLGGWMPAILLVLFFLSSSLLGRIPAESRTTYTVRQEERRNGRQVWANGFWVVLYSVGWFLMEEEVMKIATVAAIAVVTADTWATELGTLVGGATRNIMSWKRVSPGSDGAVSLTGTVSALAGAAFMAGLYQLLSGAVTMEPFWIVFAAGITGCLVDSVLGAALNKPSASCDQWNDLTNWAAAGLGSLTALIYAILI